MGFQVKSAKNPIFLSCFFGLPLRKASSSPPAHHSPATPSSIYDLGWSSQSCICSSIH